MGGAHTRYTTPKTKNNIDLSTVPQTILDQYRKSDSDFFSTQTGCGCGESIEFLTIPEWNSAPAEVTMENSRNASIVLGVDRNSTITSGYGGKCHTQCGAIDIVAGRMGPYVRRWDEEEEEVKANRNFALDAARIYVSQKADIDDYFDLCAGEVGMSEAKSAIGIKADDVRLIARSGIKLVTGTNVRDSQGHRQLEINGIDLIAGNDDTDLQPIVKGCNLVNGLSELVEEIDDLREILLSFLKYQKSFNEKLISHTHYSPFYGRDTSPAFNMMSAGIQTVIKQTAQTELSIKSHATNLSGWERNYLSAMSDAFICSSYNKSN